MLRPTPTTPLHFRLSSLPGPEHNQRSWPAQANFPRNPFPETSALGFGPTTPGGMALLTPR